MTETLEQIAQIIHTTLPKSAGVAIAMTTTADEVPGWDSLSHVRIILGVEKAFKIRIRTTEMAKLDNVGALVELVTARQAK